MSFDHLLCGRRGVEGLQAQAQVQRDGLAELTRRAAETE